MEDNNALSLVLAFGSPVTHDSRILQSLNLNLQVRVQNLETENERLKTEVSSYKDKSFIYESLTKDLASLRKQFDKTAAALLKKFDAYETLKKDYNAVKSRKSPPSTMRSRSKDCGTVSNFQSKLALYDAMECSSDEDFYADKARRPSIGSCGNLTSTNENQQSNFPFAAPTPLRNRLLMKLHSHSIKSVSTDSLVSTGRKSIKSQEIQRKPEEPIASTSTTTRRAVPVPAKIRLQNSTQLAKPAVKAPPSIRPALAQSNGQQRLVKMTNVSNIKRSNSSNSSKSTTVKPAFRM